MGGTLTVGTAFLTGSEEVTERSGIPKRRESWTARRLSRSGGQCDRRMRLAASHLAFDTLAAYPPVPPSRLEARLVLPPPSASFAKSLLTSYTAREIVYTTSGGPCKAFVTFVRTLKYRSLISQFGVTRIENSGSVNVISRKGPTDGVRGGGGVARAPSQKRWPGD